MRVATSDTGFLELSQSGRVLWIALIVTSGVILSTCFACATPFAAFATVAALRLGRRDMWAVIGLIWLINQAVGFGFMGYPLTWNCAGWGLAVGASSGLALLAARGLSTTRPAPFAVSLPFVAAFAAYEFGLYVVGYVLPGGDGAFSASVIRQVFLINAASLCGLIALNHLMAAAGRLSGGGRSMPVAAGGAAFR